MTDFQPPVEPNVVCYCGQEVARYHIECLALVDRWHVDDEDSKP